MAKYFNYKPRFNGVFSKDNLPRIKNGVCVINLDDKHSKGTHWVSLFIDIITAVYFDKFITNNIFRIQNDDFIMCRFYCIVFKGYMTAGKTLLYYTKSFPPNDYKKKKNKIIYISTLKTNMLKKPVSLDLKNRWNKKLSFRRNKT